MGHGVNGDSSLVANPEPPELTYFVVRESKREAFARGSIIADADNLDDRPLVESVNPVLCDRYVRTLSGN